MTSLRSILPLLLLGALACEAETFGADDIVIDPTTLVIAEGLPVAGNHVVLQAPWIAELPDRIELRIDDRPVTTVLHSSADGTTLGLDLPPDLSGGRHQIWVRLPRSGEVNVGTITTGGFTELRTAPGGIFGPSQPLSAVPGVVGLVNVPGGCGAQAAILDARRATLSVVANSLTCTYGVGASYRPGGFLIYREWSGGYWLRMGSALGHTVADSLAVWGNWWPTHELAPGLYLQDLKHWTMLVDRTAGSSVMLSDAGYGHPERVAFSDDGAWAVSSHSRSTDGLLIVDRNARSYHWAPGWLAYTRALFLPSGQLVVYGWRATTAGGGQQQEVLAHVDVVSGAITDSVVFSSIGSPYDVPVALTTNGWIVIPGQVGDHFELSIRDPLTLAELARPRTAPFGQGCYSYSTKWVIEDVPLNRFYVAASDCYSATPIATFQLPE